MKLMPILLTCILISWLIISFRDKIVTTKKLKKILKKDGGEGYLREYDKKIYFITEKIIKLQQQLEKNSIALSDRQQKKNQKKLEKIYLKELNRKENLVKTRKQLAILIEDYYKNKGAIPSRAIQKHLRDYLNNRKRI